MRKLTKSTVLLLLLSFFYFSANAQTGGGFGIKGGLNYNSNGKYFKDAGAAFGDPLNNLGYNLGIFGKVNLGPVFLRPELSYTQLNSEINNQKLTTQRLDAPLLVGINVLGPLFSVFAGPSLHYTIQDELRSFDYDAVNAGYQFGMGLNFGTVGLDLRYERELNNKEIDVDRVFNGSGNFRYQQIILGLSLKF
ncbi:hypothetical protein P872_12375 [Rhodonellum psychrophilum GCM71 = DSM 17998]|uniref:Outer membrane protein beta-barrel domain-containing protein n=2 Tax=Rhodonellum TaxID=336827 RepID=U5BJ84_9BACT|nr:MULTISPECIES: outer membrane beta-barrel protein [Rhodonellum]ERM80485.1 hypothetical protein P872_12375 [Rhodonellum psychrophilum GCM71 = DSM 17998]MDO9554322.1 outer membrane beta-barrel protein [Rhodonellum sp.]SDZ07109.1 Outer membrane protein beta-barrel domain-containing protein [Rhodonellum ikkaensis]